MSIDRRISPRTGLHLRIAYESAGVLKTDYVENISHGGLFVATEEPFELGQSVSLELFCLATQARIPIQAVVRWRGAQSPGPHEPPVMGVGLEFDGLKDPSRRSHLEALIDAAFEPAPMLDPRERLKVLVVDPNRHARELFKNGLEAMARQVFEVSGYLEVFEAGDGLEALEMARGIKFDLYMIELLTPEVDGAELIRLIRRQATQSTPIFAMSRPYPGDKEDALAAGADVFLHKPLRLGPLFNTLKVLLKLDARRSGPGGN